MYSKFLVIIPNNIQKVNLGFAYYESTKTIICEALSLFDVYSKYPNAISIQKIEDEDIMNFISFNKESLQ